MLLYLDKKRAPNPRIVRIYLAEKNLDIPIKEIDLHAGDQKTPGFLAKNPFAGVPILDALTITRDTTANYVYAKALGEVHNSVRQGESFSEPLGKAKVCDAIVTNMIDVGEETGDLDKMLVRVADNY